MLYFIVQMGIGVLATGPHNFFGPEHLSLKVPNVKFEFDVSAQALTLNTVLL